jgi:hypothetical protein
LKIEICKADKKNNTSVSQKETSPKIINLNTFFQAWFPGVRVVEVQATQESIQGEIMLGEVR